MGFHRLLLLAVLLCFAATATLRADEEERAALFATLRAAPNEAAADRAAADIWRYWLRAPDETAQAALDAALLRRRNADFLGALNHLDRLIAAYPDYAEGWNQRATIHFIRRDYDASLADVEEVLVREPWHFGALAGKAVILLRQGRPALAQITIREALEIHPFLRERALLEAAPGEDL